MILPRMDNLITYDNSEGEALVIIVVTIGNVVRAQVLIYRNSGSSISLETSSYLQFNFKIQII